MDNKERIDRLREIFGAKNDSDLARFIGVMPQQISRWRKIGIGGAGPSAVIDALIEHD